MKIFLNDRTIRFAERVPEVTEFNELIVEYTTDEKLQEAWEDFRRYEKYGHLILVHPTCIDIETSVVFHSFAGLFKRVLAAGGFVKNEKAEYLFIHRLGYWDLPKGKIEKSDVPHGCKYDDEETARAAAIREVKEETGIKKLRIGHELASTWHIYESKEKWALKKTRWFEMMAESDQKLKPATNEGIFLVKWTPPDAIHCILAHTYASLREFLLEIVF